MRMPHKRYRMMKRADEIQNIAQNDPSRTDIFYDSIIEHYHQRPQQFESMSLFHFASWYEKCPAPGNISNRMLPWHQLHSGAWIKRRKWAAVAKTPNFLVLSEDNFYSLLLLLLPHRDELQLLAPYTDARCAFQQKSHMFATDINTTYFTLAEEIENALSQLQLAQMN